MHSVDAALQSLQRSHFRRRFALGAKEQAILRQRGPATVRDHARKLVTERLASAAPANDGRQTPMRGHPVFIAQHATATCCRGCLSKWHRIPKGRPLTEGELDYVLAVIDRWLARQSAGGTEPADPPPGDPQRTLFEDPPG
jgi:hypothetical protein